MKYARIENNIVKEIIGFEPAGCFTEEIVNQFVECPDNVKQRWRYINNVWLEPQIILPTLEEIRLTRNYLLAQCDWTQVLDSPLSETESEEWATYRQVLRDFPEIVDLNNIVWPAKPQ